jgi:Holliday junction resolvase RusA-like endonuclease
VKEAITFRVDGKPQPAGSKRAFVLRGGANAGRAIVTDANPKSKDWKVDVKHEAQRAYSGEPWDGPIELTLRFFAERPKSHYRSGANADKLKDSAPVFPTSKPDVLKLARGVEDAITAIIWKDDAQIVTEKLTKRYGRPGVEIEIREASI